MNDSRNNPKPLLKDFSNHTHFPGTITSRFDTLVRVTAAIDRLPAPLFAGILFVCAWIPARLDWVNAFVLYAFLVGDWLLLALLPRAHKSFGPAKPPTLLLAILRALAGVLPFSLNLVAQSIGTALVIYGFWIEPQRLDVTIQSLRSNKLKARTPPLRVMHFGDLHIERITEREKQLLTHVQQLKPDLILFSGDFLSLSCVNDPVAWEHTRSLLRQLDAPLGVYVVTGSPPVDQLPVIEQLLTGLDNIRWLRDERVTLDYHGQAIDVVGITCTHKPHDDGARLDSILHGDPDNLTILLYHSPDLAPAAAEQGVDLQLAGHTHGGQVRLPFLGALYTSSLYGKRFEVGRHRLGEMTLYVTRGVGMEGKGAPRVRFLCPPEIVLWEIAPQ